ncbi:rhodanese-like domain-containing protein [Halodesulfovibrio sp.]|jgi:phage shock protein E|uniref:rhodanese-like domain-containing protein n=1 Tax=Halodesulfovibrio sp. TaxID=1912772 RepID=UPI0025F09F5A|nr:rhodanese-like domain-containing protein [Halodesulfovibrio sp.]MCT4625536.1 rhodanese-like domain-containing protein [Halodesulfovibrio sp.]
MQCIRKILFVLILVCSVSVAVAAELSRYSAEEVYDFLRNTDSAVVILDVRTPEEYASGHISGALLYDYHGKEFVRKLLELPRNAVYVVYCATGYRSIRTARFLQEAGYDVIHLDGGIEVWKALQFPIVK